MTDLIKLIVSLSLSGALLILLLFLLKPLWKDKISKQWQYYIWIIAVMRLIFPFALQTNLVGSLFGRFEQLITQTETKERGNIDILSTEDTIEPVGNGGVVPHAKEGSLPIIMYILLVWLFVALILLVRKITTYQNFVSYIKAGQVPVSDIDVLNCFAKIISETGIKKQVELTTNNLISSPLLIGFFQPCIVLPTTDLPYSEFRYTVLHELTHYRRWDMFYKWLVQLTICVHWYNPFVYLMSHEINRACELSCDEVLIRKLDIKEQQAYGDTLINAMVAGGSYKDSLSSVTLNESKELLKERLGAIMKFKKKSKFIMMITLLLTIFICVGAMSVGAYATPKNSNSNGKGYENRTESLTRAIKPFKSYGLVYDGKKDKVFYKGKEVKAFVDLKGKNSFNVGYFDDDATGSLYLETTHDKKGNVTGIKKMSEELKNDLYGDDSSDNPLPEPENKAVTYNATTTYSKYNITITDKFTSSKIPKRISEWISTCKGSKAINVKRTVSGGKIDAWVYYDSPKRLGWTTEITGNTIIFNFIDYGSTSGGTLIHYSAPSTYNRLKVYYNDMGYVTSM